VAKIIETYLDFLTFIFHSYPNLAIKPLNGWLPPWLHWHKIVRENTRWMACINKSIVRLPPSCKGSCLHFHLQGWFWYMHHYNDRMYLFRFCTIIGLKFFNILRHTSKYVKCHILICCIQLGSWKSINRVLENQPRWLQVTQFLLGNSTICINQ